jgi:hypothetical protein
MFSVFAKLLPKESDVWKIITWSLDWLYRGVFPNCDAWGTIYAANSTEGLRAMTPLAGGYFGVLWVIRGDLDWYNKTLRLNHYGSNHPCCLCPANCVEGDPMSWTDFRVGRAEWMDQVWEDTEWLTLQSNPHELFSLPGVGISTVHVDWLHTKHLGVDCYVYGSVLHMLVYSILTGRRSPNHGTLRKTNRI